MKIVFLYDALALYGGIEKIFIEKMNYLSMLPGYKIYIITTNQGQHPISFPLNNNVTHIDLNIQFHKIYKYSKFIRLYFLYKKNKIFVKRLQKCINEIQPDIITATTTHFANTTINLPCNAKKIIECHAYRYEDKNQKGLCKKIKYFKNRYNENIISKADALVTLTKESAQEWSAIKNAYIIPNMISYNTIIPSTPPTKRVIAVGRLEYEKGFDLLIQSWKIIYSQHPDWALHIFGSGSLRHRLEEQIQKEGLTKVIIIHNPTKKIYEEYIKSSIFAMSSRFEGFGLVLAEAMSVGLPCVAFNCPYGPKNIITNKEDGILVEYLNIQKFAKQINYLIEHKEIREKMGEKAKNNIKRFYPNNVIQQWTNLYETIVKQ